MPFTVAIAGITSKLAQFIALELLKSPQVSVRGSCRLIGNLSPTLRNNSRLQLFECPASDRYSLKALVKGCDIVICCYYADNETMVTAQKHLIDLCEEDNVPRYMASDYTSDYTKLNYGDLELKDPMKHIKAYLDTLHNVKGVHVLTGLLMETFWEYFGVWDRELNIIQYWGTGKEIWELTTYQDAARYVAAVALDRDAVGVIKFVGDHVTSLDVAQIVGEVYGKQPTLDNLGSLQDLHQKMLAEDDPQNPLTRGMYYMLTERFSLGKVLHNHRYPEVKPMSFREFLTHQNQLNLRI